MPIAQRDLDAEVRIWIDARAARMMEDDEVPRWTRLLDEGIRADVPEVDADPVIRQVLNASTSTALNLYVANLPNVVADGVPLTLQMQDLGRRLAQRGSDVSVVLRVYRVGQRVIWSELMQEVNDEDLDQTLRSAVLQFLWDTLSRTFEHVVERVVAAYVAEAEQRLRGSFARRSEVVAQILRGDDLDVAEATAQLAHPMSRFQVGLVVWADRDIPAADAEARLEQIARDVAGVLGAAAPLVLPAGDRELWAWATPSPIGTAAGDPAERTTLTDLTARVPAGYHVCIGEPSAGTAGFRRSHLEAQRARAVARSPVTRYRDVELVSLLSADPEAMCTFVRRELGALGDPGNHTTRLRETLLAHLMEGSSSRAAAALMVHKNTVLYRLRQASRLLGRPTDVRQFELEAALRLAAAYPEDALNPVVTSQSTD